MPSDAYLTTYFRALAADAAHGDAREESFYGSLGTLLEQVAAASGRTNAHVTTLPKKTDAGNPDFRVWDGQHHIIGYVEAKAPGVENLDAIEDSEQLERYLGTFPNLILTNFCEFRLYDEIRTYCRIVTAIAKTIGVQEQIDELYPGVEEAVVEVRVSEGREA